METADSITIGNKDNKAKELTILPDSPATNILKAVLGKKMSDRKLTYYLSRMLGIPRPQAVSISGYNQSYSYKLDRKLRDDTAIQAEIAEITKTIPDQYRNLCKLRLFNVSRIEGKALEKYNDNPELAIDKPGLLKQIKQGSGVLENDDAPKQTNIKIDKLQVLVQGALDR